MTFFTWEKVFRINSTKHRLRVFGIWNFFWELWYLLIGILRVWGKTVEVHLMIATTWKRLGNFLVQPQEGFFHQSTKCLLITSRNPKMYAYSSKKMETFADCWCESVVDHQLLWMRKNSRGLNQRLYPLHDEWDGGMIQALRLSEGCKVL